MGMFSDLIASSEAIDTSHPVVAMDRTALKELTLLQTKRDATIPTAYAARNEVQSMAANASSSGNFTLTVLLQNGETFTTASLAYNASAATIEGAIDTAATSASITGWTNGDISVSGGNANSDATVFTFDGDSVTNQNHATIVATDVDLDDSTPGVITVTTEGQPDRNALGALAWLGVMTGTPPAYRTTDTDSLAKGDVAYPNRPSASLVRALLNQASYNEQQDWHTLFKNLAEA